MPTEPTVKQRGRHHWSPVHFHDPADTDLGQSTSKATGRIEAFMLCRPIAAYIPTMTRIGDTMRDLAKFRRFCDEVRPDDFRRSSAIAVDPSGCQGTAEFDAFVERRIQDVEERFRSTEGAVDPIVRLSNGVEERVFVAYHDETNRELFARLRREARDMQATVVFVGMLVPAAKTALDLDGMDSDAVRAAIERGELRQYFGWYAEQRTADDLGEPDRRGGLWDTTDAGLGQRADGVPAVAPMFHYILA